MPIFKVMTWNVENLFRPAQSDSSAIRKRYQDKLQLLAAVISSQQPDVVGLQEVGGEEAISDLQQVLAGAFPHRAVSQAPDGRGIRNAFIASCPIDPSGTTDIIDFPPGPATSGIQVLNSHGCSVPVSRMGRAALRIRVKKGGFQADLINVHLKSKLLSFPGKNGRTSFVPQNEDQRAQVAGTALMRRAAEAVTVRSRANDILKDNDRSPLIVLGDFNDVPEAQTSMLFQGPEGSQIGTPEGTSSFHRADSGDDVRLFNLSVLIDPQRRYSRIHDGQGELLDQIFASSEFFPKTSASSQKRRLPVVDALVDFVTQLPSVSTNPSIRAKDIAPDHAPVVAAFTV